MRQHHENVISNLDIGIRFYESTVTTSGYVPFHWHSSIELVCVLAGQLTFQFDGVAHVIQANQFEVISSGVIHDVTNTPNHALVLQIPLPFIEKYVKDSATLNFQLTGQEQTADYHRIVTWFQELNRVNQQHQAGYLFDEGVLVLLMLKTLVVNFTDEKNPLTTTASGLKDLIIYINDHYRAKLRVQDLARRFGYNTSYLSRLFKQQTGVTLIEYLYMVRLSRFYQELTTTDTPISQLLDQHGLTNHRTAREMCLQMYGLLPKQLRTQAHTN